MIPDTAEAQAKRRAYDENRANPRYCPNASCQHARLRVGNEGPLCDPCGRKRDESRVLSTTPRRGNVLLPGLQAAKLDARMTWPHLGMEIGVAAETMRQWSNLANACPIEKAREIAEVLGVSLEELTGENREVQG